LKARFLISLVEKKGVNYMLRRFFLFSLIVFTITFFGLTAIAGVLDGKIFTGQEVLVGKKASGVDEVAFKDGKFISSGCIEWGFSGGDYATTADGENVHFVADTYSDKYGRITWTGTVKEHPAHPEPVILTKSLA
jgi:hypothetical protein